MKHHTIVNLSCLHFALPSTNLKSMPHLKSCGFLSHKVSCHSSPKTPSPYPPRRIKYSHLALFPGFFTAQDHSSLEYISLPLSVKCSFRFLPWLVRLSSISLSHTRDLAVPDLVHTTAHYNTGTHFLWIGDCTWQLSGAHVEYFRGIRNPIGIKVGPSMATNEVVAHLDSEEYLLFLLFMPYATLCESSKSKLLTAIAVISFFLSSSYDFFFCAFFCFSANRSLL